MASDRSTESSRGLPPKDSTESKAGRKGILLKAIQGRMQSQYPTSYLWDFYHDRHSATADYGDRLTLYNDRPIDNWMTFMQYYNNYPFTNLHLRDAAHFFKHTVRPIWEDARNQDGGAWYFRVPEETFADHQAEGEEESRALLFFQQVLLAAVGDEYNEFFGPRDDLCGVSIAKRWKAHIIMIWTRRSGESKTLEGIKDFVIAQAAPELKGVLQVEKNRYFKKHRDHDGFDNALADRLAQEYAAKKAANEIVSPDDVREKGGDGLPF